MTINPAIAMVCVCALRFEALELNGPIRQLSPNQFIDLNRERVDPQGRCNPENLAQARLIETGVVGPLCFSGIVRGPDRYDAFDFECDATELEALDNRYCKSVPTGFTGAREMHKAA